MKKYFVIAFFSAFFGALIAIFSFKHLIPHETIIIKEIPPNNKLVAESLPPDTEEIKYVDKGLSSEDFVHAANTSRKAVVFIRSFKSNDEIMMRRRFSNATGSGVIISSNGYIITNNHVVKDANTVEITLNDKREYKARIVGTDSATDLALLKIQETSLPSLEIGNSDSVKIGQWVLAIGNPFRLQSTVTAGIVSAKGRNINILERSDIESFIQTDAAVNPGNSGGALINTSGELIGINTAIITNSGGYEGFSFAIPSNLVKKVIFDIREFGAVQRGWLGISISDVDDRRAKELKLNKVSGVLVELVNSDGAAKAAGLKAEDVIIGVNGVRTGTSPEFMEQVARYRPGDKVHLEVMRKGKTFQAQVTLRNHLNTTGFVAIRKDKILRDLGFELRDLDRSERLRMNSTGILVVSIYKGSVIDETKMEPNYIITSINGADVSGVQELISILVESNGFVELNGFYEEYPGSFPYKFSIP